MNVKEIVDYCRTHRVVRVAALYVPLAWAVLRVSLIAQPGLGVPDWIPKLLAVVLIIGYPIALIISWAMDISDREKAEEKDEAAGIVMPAGYRASSGDMKKSTFGAYLLIGTAVMSAGLYAVFRLDIGTGSGSGDIPDTSIAVLPFVSLSSDPENQIFCDGLSEELLNLLAGVDALHVAARTSSYALSNQSLDVPTIGTQLRVKHVVEGSVRKVGEKIRVTAQLIRADDGYHVWSQNYDRDFADIFAVQDDIAANIVTALVSEMDVKSGAASLPISMRVDPDAYLAYLMGRGKLWRPGITSLSEAVDLFSNALEISPEFSPASAGKVFALTVLGAQQSLGAGPRLELLSEAVALNQQNPSEPLAAASVAIQSIQTYQWVVAQEALEIALGDNRNNAVLLTLYANLLLATGDGEVARSELDSIESMMATSPASDYIEEIASYELSPVSLQRLYVSSKFAFNWMPAHGDNARDDDRYVEEFRVCDDHVRSNAVQTAWLEACGPVREFAIPILAAAGHTQLAMEELTRRAAIREFDAKLLALPELRGVRDQSGFDAIVESMNLGQSDGA